MYHTRSDMPILRHRAKSRINRPKAHYLPQAWRAPLAPLRPGMPSKVIAPPKNPGFSMPWVPSHRRRYPRPKPVSNPVKRITHDPMRYYPITYPPPKRILRSTEDRRERRALEREESPESWRQSTGEPPAWLPPEKKEKWRWLSQQSKFLEDENKAINEVVRVLKARNAPESEDDIQFVYRYTLSETSEGHNPKYQISIDPDDWTHNQRTINYFIRTNLIRKVRGIKGNNLEDIKKYSAKLRELLGGGVPTRRFEADLIQQDHTQPDYYGPVAVAGIGDVVSLPQDEEDIRGFRHTHMKWGLITDIQMKPGSYTVMNSDCIKEQIQAERLHRHHQARRRATVPTLRYKTLSEWSRVTGLEVQNCWEMWKIKQRLKKDEGVHFKYNRMQQQQQQQPQLDVLPAKAIRAVTSYEPQAFDEPEYEIRRNRAVARRRRGGRWGKWTKKKPRRDSDPVEERRTKKRRVRGGVW